MQLSARGSGNTRRAVPGPVVALQLLTGALLAAYTASTVVRDGYSPLFDSWVGNLAYGGSALLCAWRAHARPTHRLGWALLALALAVFATGSVLWTTEVQFMDPIPYPSAADACFLAFYPIAYAGIAVLIRGSLPARVHTLWFDGVIAALGIATLGVSVVIGPIFDQSSGSWATVMTNLAYPVGDLLLVVLLAGFFALRSWRPGGMWWALGAGLVVFAVADSFYVWRVTNGTYETGTPLDAAWAIAAFGVAVAAWHGRDSSAPLETPAQPAAVPAVFLLSSLAVVVYATWQPVSPEGVLLASCTLLAAIARLGHGYHQLRVLAETRRQARTDELTGLGNRREFYDALRRVLDRRPRDVAVLMIDLDRFKEINDTLGHRVGDEVLRQLGPRLAAVLRHDDTLARLGGDEFGVVLTDGPTAIDLASRIQSALERPFTVDGVTLRVDASIGIASSPEHGSDADVLLQKADIAMYEAKRSRQGWAVYSPGRDLNSRDRLELVEELRKAIARRELVPHYQTKLDIQTGRLTGVEALVRWPHRTRGVLTPDQFVPLAEQAGLISGLTRLVLDEAIARRATWARQGLELTMAVNLSVVDLADEQLPVIVAALLERHGVPADALVLEITENGVMSDPARAQAVLTKLRKLGCQLAIDDYGTGSSSLGYLRDLPVTELKLDRSFLADALTDDRARSIVRSTIGLAHELGLRIVAEGVENEATLSLLESLGCDAAQGFHIGRAVPASEIARALLPAPPTPPWRAAPLGHRPPARRLHTELRTVS